MLQGEREMASDNKMLGQFDLVSLPAGTHLLTAGHLPPVLHCSQRAS